MSLAQLFYRKNSATQAQTRTPAAGGVRAWRKDCARIPRRKRMIFEALEPRLLLSTVLWDGGGDGISWYDPRNWNGDVLPTVDDDVVIDVAGSATVRHSTGTTEVRSLTSRESLELTGGSLNVTGAFTITGGSTFTIAGGVTLDMTGDLIVTDGSRVVAQGKHTSGQVAGQWAGVGVTLHAATLTLDATSQLTADGQGYVGGGAWSNASGAGPGGGATNYNSGGGGGHGGTGGAGSDVGGGGAYGSQFEPTTLGAGGGRNYDNSPTGRGGQGGGAIRLLVDGTLTLDGTVSARGAGGVGGEQGGGAGGSLWVTAGTLTGSGAFIPGGLIPRGLPRPISVVSWGHESAHPPEPQCLHPALPPGLPREVPPRGRLG